MKNISQLNDRLRADTERTENRLPIARNGNYIIITGSGDCNAGTGTVHRDADPEI